MYSLSGSLVYLKESTPSFAAITTKNAFPGASIILLRERMKEKNWRAIHVNNCLSNVLVGTGYADAESITESVGTLLEVPREECLSISTGIIGWRLPVDEMNTTIRALSLAENHDVLDFAQAIKTTDRYPKLLRHSFDDGSSICMVAKGAGMVEPNMATMLVFIFTDVALPRESMQTMLVESASKSFNTISIDSDTSTSDSVLFLSSNRYHGVDENTFFSALEAMSQKMATDIVQNGEGTTHVIKVTTKRAPSTEIARQISRGVANSLLVKSAIYGNDPNVGRILMAIGKSTEDQALVHNTSVFLGETLVFQEGKTLLNQTLEKKLGDYLRSMQQDSTLAFPENKGNVDIVIDLDAGDEQAQIIGSDLSQEYVSINAEYRS